MKENTPNTLGRNTASPATSPASDATQRRLSRLEDRLLSLLSELNRGLPVWIRSPKSGSEHYTGFSRAKLYALVADGSIRSVSIREPGAIKGTRLFELASILAFIEKCEAPANSKEAK